MRHAIRGMAAFAVVLSAPLSAQGEVQPVSINSLADMPGTRVAYYDVTGSNVTEINRSIARQRPRTWDGKPIPATTSWAVRTGFDRSETGGQCRVTAARASFSATANLPRLAANSKIDKVNRERWQQYVGQLEQGSLATVAFVYSNLANIERAMLASNCDTAKPVASAAIERLRVQAAKLDSDREKRLARQNASLTEFLPTGRRIEKTQCRSLDTTGTRLGEFRICLPVREWDRMWTDSRDNMRSFQDSYSKKGSF